MEDNVKGKIWSPEPKLCPSLLPLCVDVRLFGVLYVWAKHPTVTLTILCITLVALTSLSVFLSCSFLQVFFTNAVDVTASCCSSME